MKNSLEVTMVRNGCEGTTCQIGAHFFPESDEDKTAFTTGPTEIDEWEVFQVWVVESTPLTFIGSSRPGSRF